MFHQHVQDMQRSVNRLLLRRRIPSHVHILKEQADYLGVKYTQTIAQNPDKSWGSLAGEEYGPLVKVKLSNLYTALRGAVGVNANEQQREAAKREASEGGDSAGQPEAKDQDHVSGD